MLNTSLRDLGNYIVMRSGSKIEQREPSEYTFFAKSYVPSRSLQFSEKSTILAERKIDLRAFRYRSRRQTHALTSDHLALLWAGMGDNDWGFSVYLPIRDDLMI